jgi:hypothetical protein
MRLCGDHFKSHGKAALQDDDKRADLENGISLPEREFQVMIVYEGQENVT